MVGVEGLMGTAARECWRYQMRTASLSVVDSVRLVVDHARECRPRGDPQPLCPNFAGSEDAPATANCFAEKNFFTAACMLGFSLIFLLLLELRSCISSTARPLRNFMFYVVLAWKWSPFAPRSMEMASASYLRA